MFGKELIKSINKVVGGNVNYLPYDISQIVITYGVPPIPIRGLEYVWAKHNNPQKKLVMSLNGKGVFVSNNNTSGIIEIALLGESVSCAGIQAMGLTGIPFPIAISDMTTGATSSVLASACQLVETPEWRREKMPSLNIFTFATPKLIISNGLRLPEP